MFGCTSNIWQQMGFLTICLANHVSACRAKCTMYGLQFVLWDHLNVSYLLKSMKIIRPIVVTKQQIIDLSMLHDIAVQCVSM